MLFQSSILGTLFLLLKVQQIIIRSEQTTEAGNMLMEAVSEMASGTCMKFI